VHRFAQIPQLARPPVDTAPVAVWIDGEAELRTRTRGSLDGGSVPPAAVLEGDLAEALNSTRAEHVLLVTAGDTLASLAVERFGQAAALEPRAAVITCDEDQLDSALRRHTPRFRPAPSPDRWLACDDSSRTLLVRREDAQRRLGELADDDAWRHELALRLAGPGANGAAHVPLLLSHRGAAVGPDPVLGLEPVRAVLRESEPDAGVEFVEGVRRVRRPPGVEPEVEVVICLRDKPGLLARCVDTLLAMTEYARLKLALVDNGSQEERTLELLAGYERRLQVRVLRDRRPFNFAALNNAAARSSRADVLVFLNNDTEVVQADWASVLLEEALRPNVGAVAPMLLYPTGNVQHAGAAVGLHGYAGHPFAGLRPDAETPFGRADGGTRNWMAVTAACLMVERAKFARVGGFDESFVVAGNDVDLCLRLTAAGYRSLCVPHAVLVHDESRSRGAHIDPADFVRSAESYGEFRTVGDPFYNPNLTLDATDCSLRSAGGAT
jgi:GT2 family glycosyltransferase